MVYFHFAFGTEVTAVTICVCIWLCSKALLNVSDAFYKREDGDE